MSFTNTIKFHEIPIENLWVALRAGDKSALESIYRYFIKDLYSFGMSIHADETIVKDAIQDVFIDLWNYRAKLSSEVDVKQYLLKSLSNRVQKELGKNARRTSAHWMTDQESTVDSIENEMVQNQFETEITSKMYEAMSELPIRQKEVLQYLFFEKLTYEQTANLLDINIRSTYTLAWKAINSLKKAITTFALFFTFLQF